jgi:hypothetical protein
MVLSPTVGSLHGPGNKERKFYTPSKYFRLFLVHTYMHACIHTYIHAAQDWLKTVPTHLPTYLPSYIHTYLPTYIPTYLPTILLRLAAQGRRLLRLAAQGRRLLRLAAQMVRVEIERPTWLRNKGFHLRSTRLYTVCGIVYQYKLYNARGVLRCSMSGQRGMLRYQFPASCYPQGLRKKLYLHRLLAFNCPTLWSIITLTRTGGLGLIAAQ